MAPFNNFEPNKQRPRQTELLDDVTAIIMAQPDQQRKRGGGKTKITKVKQDFKLNTAQNAAISKTKAAAPRGAGLKNDTHPRNVNNLEQKILPISDAAHEATPEFYEENGLRIALYHKGSGKKRTHARDGAVLAHREPLKQLYSIVREYAGEAKVKEFQDSKASRRVLGAWIQKVEIEAFGQGPKTTREGAEREHSPVSVAGAPELKKHESTNQKVLEIQRANAHSDGVPSKISTNSHGKRKREVESMTTLPQQTPKKPKTHLQPSTPKKAPEHVLVSQHEKLSPSQKGSRQKEKSHQAFTNASKHSKKERSHVKTQQADEVDMALYLVKVNNTHQLKEHPLIDAMELNHSWDPRDCPESSSTKVLYVPAQNTKVIVTATSQNAVHTTEVPMTDAKTHAIKQGKHQHLRSNSDHQYRAEIKSESYIPTLRDAEISQPYLKAGKHGWDYDNHHWAFEGDPDLYTGVGHQVEPVDAIRYAQAEAKYFEQRRLIDDTLAHAKEKYQDDMSKNEYARQRNDEKMSQANGQYKQATAENETRLLTWKKTYMENYEAAKARLERKWKQARVEHAHEETKLWRDWANHPVRLQYQHKYPGMRGDQWPCGCQVPRNDETDESEAE